ncbi:MAG: endonuclease/exonuclease/phosphatase family protein [Bacteroidetes bacterium]|nr:endonuclease/exonuclease/phosphatase family protein [Bacteroidota bacterium]
MNRRLVLLLISVTAVAAIGLAQPSDLDDDQPVFTVATYNVKNLFDQHDDPYFSDEKTRTVPKPMEEVKALASVIHLLDVDVIALQEVESRGVLRKFKNGLLKTLGYRTPILYEGNDMRGIDVAFLSRLRVGSVTSHRHLRFLREGGAITRFSRDLLRARVYPADDFWFDLYIVHFKSGWRKEDVLKREAEATKAREILDEELGRDPPYRFMIVGDFNDRRESEVVKLIEGKDEGKLFCPTDELPEEERITFILDSVRTQVDYIFCSPSMRSLYVSGSVKVIHGDEAAVASDHRPVSASFTIPPQK